MKLVDLSWKDHPNNPLINPPFPEWIIADPSVLSAHISPDGKWHLFAHGVFGIYHYTSYNGVDWKLFKSRLIWFALRPFLYKEKKTYYLIYEKLTLPGAFPYYNTRLEIISSTDMKNWSKPIILLQPSLPWHKTKNKIGNLGNPSVVKTTKGYRLYYSSGLIQPPDSLFCEPLYQGYATSKRITGPYISHPTPLTKKHHQSSVHKSATRVFQFSGAFWGLQTLMNLNRKIKKSSSSLHLSSSLDGIKFTASKLIISPGQRWKKTHVYVGSLMKKFNGRFRIYYNARTGPGFFNRESIGMATSE